MILPELDKDYRIFIIIHVVLESEHRENVTASGEIIVVSLHVSNSANISPEAQSLVELLKRGVQK